MSSRLSTTRRAARGLTLVELMVVILIIAILASVIGFAVSGAFAGGAKAEADGTVRTIKGMIESFRTNYHTVPPSSIGALSIHFGRAGVPVEDPNPTNRGIEALVYVLRSPVLIGGRLLSDEDFNRLQINTDDEEGSELLTDNFLNVPGDPKLYELRDPWGNPFVYVCFADEAGLFGLDQVIPVMLADKTIVEVNLDELKAKLIHPTTGLSVAREYALWSFGPDGVNEYGRGDDIVSWVKIEE